MDKKKAQWLESIEWLIGLSSALNIIPKEHISYIRSRPHSGNQNWNILYGYLPTNNGFVDVHPSLGSLTWKLDLLKACGICAHRVGLVIGDFRVGTSSAHRSFLQHAKEAVGLKGQLVVVTPSSKTIINTTSKTTCWPDEERLDALRNNKHVDQLWMANMPEEYYSDTSAYWQKIWRSIKPDIVFLGEAHHPLQPIYKRQSMYLGGILLIDNVPVTIRSEELLIQK